MGCPALFIKNVWLQTMSWPKEQRMVFFNVVNEAQEAGVPDVKIRLYYQNNEAEMAGPQHLNPCLSTQSFYTCCTAQTWEFLFLIGYACLVCHS